MDETLPRLVGIVAESKLPLPAATAGRRALITGASGGIGLEVARGLASRGFDLLLPVRNRDRGEAARRAILETAPMVRVQLADLDLASLDSVSGLASRLCVDGSRLDLLILNAGIVNLGERDTRFTEDGFEVTYQTNFLGHFALVLGLLPLLRASATRVVVQCSIAAARGRFSYEDPAAPRASHPFRSYRQSKLALGLFGLELARRSAAHRWGFSVQLCHPGITPGSGIAPAVRHKLPGAVRRLAGRLGNSPMSGAQTALAAAHSTAPTPRMYAPSKWFGIAGSAKERAPFATFGNEREAIELWRRTEALLATRATGDETRPLID